MIPLAHLLYGCPQLLGLAGVTALFIQFGGVVEVLGCHFNLSLLPPRDPSGYPGDGSGWFAPNGRIEINLRFAMASLHRSLHPGVMEFHKAQLLLIHPLCLLPVAARQGARV